jgi:hypothetical protein
MKYIKLFEDTSNGELKRCTALFYKKTNQDNKGYWNLERSGDKVFTGKNCLDKAINYTKDLINKGEIDSCAIYKSMQSSFTKPDNLLRWWSSPDCNTGENPLWYDNRNGEQYASKLSKYIFGMVQAYLTFVEGSSYKDRINLDYTISKKAPKAWEKILALSKNPEELKGSSDLGAMGFGD